MKLGFGLYKHMLTAENYAFARQCGATHLVVHLVDYFNQADPSGASDLHNQPVNAEGGCWGRAGDPDNLWTVEQLAAIKEDIESHGLEWYALENFDPAHWHDILLAGPLRDQQIENVKAMIRTVGEVGIPVIGYNFSLAGVSGRVEGPYARGGARSVGMEGTIDDTPMADGIVWNMQLDDARAAGTRARACVDAEELWGRLAYFLEAVMPTAEAAGVKLALHPDDPPVDRLRGTPRLVNRPDLYQRALDTAPSPSNMLEFCLGTIAEMPTGDVHEATKHYASQSKIAYVHFRNVVGKVPHYKEVFVDEGDINMHRILTILKAHNFDGVLIPDHTPQMSTDTPWHTGMAYAMGYMKALLSTI
ncbi:MAG: mannonate dehydratase [Puniceicoccaceae bacterium]